MNKEGNVILRSNFILCNILTERSLNINFEIRQNLYILNFCKSSNVTYLYLKLEFFLQNKLLMDVQNYDKIHFPKTNYIHKETLSLDALIDYLKIILKIMIIFELK